VLKSSRQCFFLFETKEAASFKEQGWVSYNIKGKLLKKIKRTFSVLFFFPLSVNDGTKKSPPKRKELGPWNINPL